MKRFSKVIAFGLAASLLLAGCGSGGSSAGTGSGTTASSTSTDDAHLNFGCYMYSTSNDPAAYQNAAWQGVRLGITECLFKFDEDMVAQPQLAESIESSDDKMTWTITIKDGIQFSNGNDCDAQAVADSLNRLYYVCANDTDYSSTPSAYLDVESIAADAEANTVTIQTTQAYADIAGILSFPFYSIIDVEGDTTDAEHADGYAETVVGTGPYALDSFDATTKNAELVRNEYYWDGEVPYATISAIFVEEDLNKSMSIQSGDIDLTENITIATELEALEEDDAYTVTKADGLRSGFAYVNFDGVLSDDDLREAVFMAIDHATMCDITVGGLYSDGIGILPDFLGYNDGLTTAFDYDVDAAIEKLDAAGIVDTDGDGIREIDGENIDLNYVTYDNRCLSTFAEAIQASLSEIGIGCTVTSTDSDTEWNLMQAGEYDLCDSNWITAGTGDPIVFLANWYADGGDALYDADSGEGANYCNYQSDEFDALYEQYNASLDTDERAELVTQMEQILVDDCAVLLHGYYASTMISNSIVTGAQISSIDYYWLNTDIRPAD